LADPILASHLADLGPAYRIFDTLESAELRREAARLIDFLRAEQISIPDSLGDPPGDAIPCLRKSVERAHPDRKCVTFVLAGFSGWLSALRPESRPEFLEWMPALAPAALDLGETGMARVVEVANIDPLALRPIAAYAMTTAEAIRAVVRIAAEAAKRGRIDLVQKLADTLPAEKMEESKDAERLPGAIAEATGAAAGAWTDAMLLAIDLTKVNTSSAFAAMSALPGALRKVPDPAAYLTDFRNIVEAIGLQAVGTCTGSLAAWHSTGNPEAVRRFVQLACEAGGEYGVAAGMAFLERKTPAAREAFLRQ
jgi:hypothetical protein